jgi:hypothetical protein
LRSWLQTAYYDFQEDPKLKETLIAFINKDMMPTMKNPADQILKLIEKKV